MITFLQIYTPGGVKAHTAHFAFKNFFSVGWTALKTGNFYFTKQLSATSNTGQCWSYQFTFGDFAATNDCRLGGIENTTNY